MDHLSAVAGYILCVLVGTLGILVLWRIADGTIDLSRLISESNGDASMSRFQFLVFTFVIALSLFVVIVSCKDNCLKFPDIPGTVLSLLGISGSSYLVSKGIQFSDPAGIQDRALEIVVTPSKPLVRVGKTQQFTAETPRKPNASVKWEVVAGYGDITNTGLYTADLNRGPAAPQAPNAPPPTLPVYATIQATVEDQPDVQALSPAKREAQGRVASIILPKKLENAAGLSDSFGQLRPTTEFR